MRKVDQFQFAVRPAIVVISLLMFGCKPNSEQEGKSLSTKVSGLNQLVEQKSTYEFRADPDHQFELRHYKDESRQDSLFIFQGKKLIHGFICKEADSEFGPFADSVLIKVSKKSKRIEKERVNLLMIDSILYIPLTMSFNGGFYLMLYDIPSRLEITYKDDDLWSRHSAFVFPGRKKLLVCKGQNVSQIDFELFKIDKNQLFFEEKLSIDENDRNFDAFLEKIIK